MTHCILWFKNQTEMASECQLKSGMAIAVRIGKELVSDFSYLREMGLEKVTVNGRAVLRLN